MPAVAQRQSAAPVSPSGLYPVVIRTEVAGSSPVSGLYFTTEEERMIKTTEIYLPALDGMVGEKTGCVSVVYCDPMTGDKGEEKACTLKVDVLREEEFASIRITPSQLRDIADMVEAGAGEISFGE